MTDRATDTRLLDLAVRSAVRGHGHVEPNPMVGCVVSDGSGRIVAVAHHERHGDSHAEVLAAREGRCIRSKRQPPCDTRTLQSSGEDAAVRRCDHQRGCPGSRHRYKRPEPAGIGRHGATQRGRCGDTLRGSSGVDVPPCPFSDETPTRATMDNHEVGADTRWKDRHANR